ncbi:hypothetical protein [Roseivirga seohaensis]|uniref:hypothetical protein n=1 Tax=Roseivirga seohaensis TaxID=1914963 RepID=UPI003BAB7A00
MNKAMNLIITGRSHYCPQLEIEKNYKSPTSMVAKKLHKEWVIYKEKEFPDLIIIYDLIGKYSQHYIKWATEGVPMRKKYSRTTQIIKTDLIIINSDPFERLHYQGFYNKKEVGEVFKIIRTKPLANPK